MPYVNLNISPTKGQAQKLETAFRKSSETTIQLKPSQVGGNMSILVTQSVANRVAKNASAGKGTRITIKNPRQQIPAGQSGGSIFSVLASLAGPLMKGVAAAAPNLARGLFTNLASGAVSALGSLGLNKLFGRGGATPNLSLISPMLKHLVSNKATRDAGIKMLFGGTEPAKVKKELLKALAGFPADMKKVLLDNLSNMGVKIGRGQQGGFLGTLAAVGIPLVMQLLGGLFGKGQSGGFGIGYQPGPMITPPFIGSWKDYGVRGRGRGKKKG